MKSILFLHELLNIEDCIICDLCKSLMYKVPLNIPYERIGRKYTIKGNDAEVKYIYCCENFNAATSEYAHHQKQYWVNLRKKLEAEGESYLPNEFGFWHWYNDNKKTRPSLFGDELKECNHVWDRKFEFINVACQKSPFVKITEKCIYCNFLNNIV